MHEGKYVFAQVMEFLPRHDFDRCVERYQGDRNVKQFPCRDQFLAMVFGQLSGRESLRDTATCLSAHRSKLYHLGFHGAVAKTTLSRSNEKRDWRIYRDLAQLLIPEAQKQYVEDPDIAADLSGACYAIDSTSIELCLSLFRWAPYMDTKGAVKLHLLLDLRGSIPTFFDMTDGKVHDVHFLDKVIYEQDAFYVMDRGYVDFGRLRAIHRAGALFVTREKDKLSFKRRYSNPVDRTTGIMCDQIIFLTGKGTSKKYPDTLRRIKYYDEETAQEYVYLTNNFSVSAVSIALLYKNRWKIELFFKWIKQHLKVKVFWGRSENAVKTQICIALCAYLLVAILKKKLGIGRSIYEILQILSVSLLDKTPLFTLLSGGGLQNMGDGFQNTLPGLGF